MTLGVKHGTQAVYYYYYCLSGVVDARAQACLT